MRRDAVGLFWDDTPPPKPEKAEKPKRTPPAKTWLEGEYLPYFKEACEFALPMFDEDSLIKEWLAQVPLVYDIECYINYFCICFRSTESGKLIYFEFNAMGQGNMDYRKLAWVMQNFCLISFNGRNYDEPMAYLALGGCSNAQLKEASDRIIVEEWRPSDVLKSAKIKKPFPLNHIDIQEVGPGVRTSLKKYAGRTHAEKLQDLPYPPNWVLTNNQQIVVRFYCANDLENTFKLYLALKDRINLREHMSKEYGVDLRSRSDAQVAEDVIRHEITALNRGQYIKKAIVEVGRAYPYNAPAFLQYQTPLMNSVFDIVKGCNYIVGEDGKIKQPPAMDALKFTIGNSVYKMGIGGLHSTEKKAINVVGPDEEMEDVDVASFYPKAILNQELYPPQLGRNFLSVYQKIVDRRLEAKRKTAECKKSGDIAGEKHWKLITESLKITINGSYGKFGSMYSILYAPHLVIQTTLTGQLGLLMLIEMLELNGISAVSANTDGVVVRFKKEKRQLFENIVKNWENVCDFEMEASPYAALYAANVNNYIAIKPNGETKRKGWYGEPGLAKDPEALISMEAVIEWLKNRTPLEQTIQACTDIRKFVVVKAVNAGGGGVFRGEFLGKVVRWYYTTEEVPEMVMAKSGNLVPKSTGGKPLMQLPEQFPTDVDYDRYVKIAEEHLKRIGFEF